ncbi:MAG: FlgD immunoglobulin-like domain containing protein [Candidatus Krumholzibacteriia bacterium]
MSRLALACVAALATFGVAAARLPASTDHVVVRIDNARAEGLLSADEALLLSFQWALSPGDLPPEWRDDSGARLRSGTNLVQTYHARREQLSPEIRERIELLLAPGPTTAALQEAVSPAGRFRLSYTTVGPDAVAADDTEPRNGIPDLVDRAAGALDRSWDVLCAELGFAAPPVQDLYQVEFRDMAFNGLCVPVIAGGATRIILSSTFAGASPNDDPDGHEAGVLRVTCAHEFKHASQYAGSRWSEGGWIELDAVWAEEAVFPAVNDYVNYLRGGCPVRQPEVPLDHPDGTGNYEDVVWQLWLEQEFGVEAVTETWARRAARPDEDMLSSYAHVLLAHGSSLAEGWSRFTAWNYAVGTRARPDLGYLDAALYLAAAPTNVLSCGAPAIAGTVEPLAAHFLGGTDLAGASGWLRVHIEAASSSPLVVTAVIERRDGATDLLPLLRDHTGVWNVWLPVPAEEVADLGVVIGNPAVGNAPGPYQARLRLETQPPAPVLLLPRRELYLDLGRGPATVVLPVTNQGPAGSQLAFEVQAVAGHGALDPGEWLTCLPATGIVPAGGTKHVEISVNAADLEPGRHEALLRVSGPAVATQDALLVVTVPRSLHLEARETGVEWLGAYPNPFNPATSLRFSLPKSMMVRLEIFDARGRHVRTVWDGALPAGERVLSWDGRGGDGGPVGAGVYVARLHAGEHRVTAKLLLNK